MTAESATAPPTGGDRARPRHARRCAARALGWTAARGEIPQSFAPVVVSLSPMQRDYACVHWGAARLIERMDPFIGAVAQAAGLSDATLDELFGVSTPASWE